MTKTNAMLFLFAETAIHAGTGRGLGAVDLPIQRERVTGYPLVQASSVKGKLRAEASKLITAPNVEMLFGPEKDPDKHAGAVSFGDARLLLFPVRSLRGVFAWVTSLDALERFAREAGLLGLPVGWKTPAARPDKDEAWVSGDALGKPTLVLEEFSFQASLKQAEFVKMVGDVLAKAALPKEYTYWQQELPKKLCILHEDAFRDFVLYSTEVQTHIRLDPAKKTVQRGALWTSESLPADSLIYAPVLAGTSRVPGETLDATEVLKTLLDLNIKVTNLGGDETTGQGFVSLRWYAGGEQ